MQVATAVQRNDTVISPQRVYMHHLLTSQAPGDLFGPDAADEAPLRMFSPPPARSFRRRKADVLHNYVTGHFSAALY